MVTRKPTKTLLDSLPLKAISTRAAPLVLLLVAASLLVFHKIDILPASRLQTAVSDAVVPVLDAVSAPFSAAASSIDSVATLRTLKAENIRLQEENEKLRQWYEAALRLAAENASYRELLNVRAAPEMSFVSARVVSDPGGAFVKSVLLPVGARDDVTKGSAVLSGQGLIGRVIEVGRNSARVLLITDVNSRIPVLVQNTRTRAILAGANGDLLRLERLPPDSGLSVGERIVTSGDGGQLPPDIPIGTIVEVSSDGVLVKPLADIARVIHVQVVNAVFDPALSTGSVTP